MSVAGLLFKASCVPLALPCQKAYSLFLRAPVFSVAVSAGPDRVGYLSLVFLDTLTSLTAVGDNPQL